MIQPATPHDTDAVLSVWLQTSKQAHDFITPDFWDSQLPAMKDIYLPAATTYVYHIEDTVCGFYSMVGDTLAAIFVLPCYQGQGIGKQLINHAKTRHQTLTLTVYKDNQASVGFYKAQGFVVTQEQVDTHTGQRECVMVFNT